MQYPWQKGKQGFSWPKYLEHCKAKAAPIKLFKDPFPYIKNQFRVGMKLEGIDPEHPSRYCVLTIVEVVGKSLEIVCTLYCICVDIEKVSTHIQ